MVTCQIDSVESDRLIPRQAVLDYTKPFKRLGNQAQRDRRVCLSGGRAARRQNITVPVGGMVSADWGNTILVKINGTFVDTGAKQRKKKRVTIVGANLRDEAVNVTLTMNDPAVTTIPMMPASTTLAPGQTKNLAVVSKNNASEFWPGITFSYTAQPLQYEQSEVNAQLYSNRVFLIIEHRRRISSFYVYNERIEIDAPVAMNINVMPTGTTQRSNLKMSRPNPVRVKIPPHTKQLVLTIEPADILLPWSYAFDYTWQAGTVPLELFGLAPQ